MEEKVYKSKRPYYFAFFVVFVIGLIFLWEYMRVAIMPSFAREVVEYSDTQPAQLQLDIMPVLERHFQVGLTEEEVLQKCKGLGLEIHGPTSLPAYTENIYDKVYEAIYHIDGGWREFIFVSWEIRILLKFKNNKLATFQGSMDENHI